MEDKTSGLDEQSSQDDGASTVPSVAVALSGIKHPGQNGEYEPDENAYEHRRNYGALVCCSCYVKPSLTCVVSCAQMLCSVSRETGPVIKRLRLGMKEGEGSCAAAKLVVGAKSVSKSLCVIVHPLL